MSGLEVNKILASIILAILVVTVIGHLGDILINVKPVSYTHLTLPTKA